MYYTGTVNARDLYQEIVAKITAVQAGNSVAWWKKESSLEADGVFTSTGDTGVERIVFVLRPGVAGHYLIGGYARDYTAGVINTTGAFDNISVSNLQYYTTVKAESVLVTYHLSVTKNRIILHVQGDKLVTGWANTVAYIGMPIRYDTTDKKCIAKAISEQGGTTNKVMLVEDSLRQPLQLYDWRYVESLGNPSWGNNYFLEPLHFGKLGEGMRGELDGLYGIHSENLVDGDIVEVNGTSYLIVRRIVNGINGFPRETLAMRMT